jgi:hypothetical protein
MHRKIGLAIKHRGLNFFGEHPLLIHLDNRVALVTITAGGNFDQLYRRAKIAQAVGHPIRLPESQLARASANA